jgi:hypothetical protein
MELKFEELEEEGQVNKINYANYWSNDNSVKNEKIEKPRISYDDILSSLNMVVNNGVLQFAKPINQAQQTNKQQTNKQEVKQEQKKRVTINAPMNQQSQQPQYSYITNKYFKDYYQQQSVIEEPEVPMTKEEYKKMLIQDYINRQQAQRRISEIKSRRLLFDTRNINISPNQMPRDMNKLFKSFSRK